MLRWRALALGIAFAGVAVAGQLAGSPHAQAADPIRVYVFAGQSNMVGAATSSAELRTMQPNSAISTDDVQFWGPTADEPHKWTPLQAPTEIVQPDSHNGYGPEIGAARLLAQRHRGATIAIVKLAVNGTNLSWSWNPHRTSGLYNALVNRVRGATTDLRNTTNRPTKIAGFFWMQGESDAMNWRNALAYRPLLQDFITSLRTDLRSSRLPVVIGRIFDMRKINAHLGRHSDVVRRAQADVAGKDPYTFLVSTDGLERDSMSPIHFSSRGTYDLGRRFVSKDFPL